MQKIQTAAPGPVRVVGADRRSDFVVSCDHAQNRVPADVAGGDLGIAPADLDRHIAYDVGAEGLTLKIADRLGAPAVLSTFSRLVIDPNRGRDDPTLIMRLYDGTVIPGNSGVDAAERARRIAAYWQPYHDGLAAALEERPDSALAAIHSFTPQLRHRAPRPWHVGVLYPSAAPALGHALIRRLRAQPGLIVGENQPYRGDLADDSIDRHAVATGRPGVLIEVRNDLIRDAAGQEEWAARLAPALLDALAEIRPATLAKGA